MGLFDSLKKAFGGGKEETVEEQKYDTGLEKKPQYVWRQAECAVCQFSLGRRRLL